MDVPERQIRGRFTDETITVYQAYGPEIARPAVARGTLVPPFRRGRMTWIKPSFRWMMYRCGWASKPGQEHVLAIDIRRAGFEWALGHACLSQYDARRHGTRDAWRRGLRESPVRVQWDPERSMRLAALAHRSVQIGLCGEAVDRYLDEWIVAVTDVTDVARRVGELVARGSEDEATRLLPVERPYPLDAELADAIGATAPGQPDAGRRGPRHPDAGQETPSGTAAGGMAASGATPAAPARRASPRGAS